MPDTICTNTHYTTVPIIRNGQKIFLKAKTVKKRFLDLRRRHRCVVLCMGRASAVDVWQN